MYRVFGRFSPAKYRLFAEGGRVGGSPGHSIIFKSMPMRLRSERWLQDWLG